MLQELNMPGDQAQSEPQEYRRRCLLARDLVLEMLHDSTVSIFRWKQAHVDNGTRASGRHHAYALFTIPK